ncbi:hypothetical protein BDA96_10G090600 [Sorghum bicolor]|uniref:Uncharacterized protein n=2 Tax=Sorghum bicolor TaxID=4558 RepID=A0A921U0F6_SORBI|nr:hypothetical protein BDA96_10G090600 [Sorghum bicolor]OQU76013.1 hypothetical protein SORBI_3010G074980 [Sorghum bicolor]
MVAPISSTAASSMPAAPGPSHPRRRGLHTPPERRDAPMPERSDSAPDSLASSNSALFGKGLIAATCGRAGVAREFCGRHGAEEHRGSVAVQLRRRGGAE